MPINIHLRILVTVLLLGGMLFSCSGKKQEKEPENETVLEENGKRGEVNIAIDETLEPLMKQVVKNFLGRTPKATLHVFYVPEGEGMQMLLEDSVRVFFGTRDFLPAERQVIEAAQIKPRTVDIGAGAVAVLVNKDLGLEKLSNEELAGILKGEIKNWNEVEPELGDVKVSVIYDTPSSSVVRMVLDTYIDTDSLPANSYSAGNTAKLIEFVEQSPGAIGLIGYAYISDRDDSVSQDILSRVRLVSLEAPDTSKFAGSYYLPYQNEIKLGRYALSRPFVSLSREHFMGLGTGFVNFTAGEIGQRILLKAGYVPAFAPPRVIVLPEKEEEVLETEQQN